MQSLSVSDTINLLYETVHILIYYTVKCDQILLHLLHFSIRDAFLLINSYSAGLICPAFFHWNLLDTSYRIFEWHMYT